MSLASFVVVLVQEGVENSWESIGNRMSKSKSPLRSGSFGADNDERALNTMRASVASGGSGRRALLLSGAHGTSCTTVRSRDRAAPRPQSAKA